MFKKLLFFCLSVTTMAIMFTGCGASNEEVATEGHSSPPPPPAAPSQANNAVGSASTDNATKPTTGQGTPVKIVNEDPAGSGEYKFSPSDFTFKLGETVDFTMTAETELHNFSVDDLGIDEDVEPDDPVTFSYTFDKAGTYQFICIFHEVNGMVGTITVE